MKTIKELFPEISGLERCKIGEKASLFGIKRVGDKVKEDGNCVCLYNESDFESLFEIKEIIVRNKIENE